VTGIKVGDGENIEDFTDCVLTGTSTGNCGCADMDANEAVNGSDTTPFVDALVP
jgi:hypothetical protein